MDNKRAVRCVFDRSDAVTHCRNKTHLADVAISLRLATEIFHFRSRFGICSLGERGIIASENVTLARALFILVEPCIIRLPRSLPGTTYNNEHFAWNNQTRGCYSILFARARFSFSSSLLKKFHEEKPRSFSEKQQCCA